MRGVALRVGPFIAAMPVTVVLPFEPKKVSEASAVNERSKVPPMPLQLNNPEGKPPPCISQVFTEAVALKPSARADRL